MISILNKSTYITHFSIMSSAGSSGSGRGRGSHVQGEQKETKESKPNPKMSKALGTSAKRIQKELAEITLDPPPNCSAGPKGENFYEWVSTILGPPGKIKFLLIFHVIDANKILGGPGFTVLCSKLVMHYCLQ